MRAALAKIASRLRRQPYEPDSEAEPVTLAALSPADREIVRRAQPFSMVSVARLVAVVDAVRYVVARELPGAFAECGVWRGGSVLAMIYTLQELGRDDRDIHLYDTFEGMTKPGPADVSAAESALETWNAASDAGERPWSYFFGEHVFEAEDVVARLVDTGYPPHRLHVARGPVERTLPDAAPDSLAMLRLDTDWYESTRHELEHLYPRLVRGGVLLLDDYGHWEGAGRAADEYFAANPPRPLLARTDYTGRLAVKA